MTRRGLAVAGASAEGALAIECLKGIPAGHAEREAVRAVRRRTRRCGGFLRHGRDFVRRAFRVAAHSPRTGHR
jgi:hypothetical protein